MKLPIKSSLLLLLALSFTFFTISPAYASDIRSIQAVEENSEQANILSTNSDAVSETYNNLLQAITHLEDKAYFPSDEISYKELSPILNDVLADHPEIFYFQHEGTLVYSNGEIKLNYKYPKAEIKDKIQKLDLKANEIIKQTIKQDYSDYEKVKAVHDYIVLNTSYDWDNYQTDTIPETSYTSYGLLINEIAVCDGYAKAMKLILEKVGVETHYVTGYGKEELHAWNLVNIDGEYFYVDATWDDPVPDREGQIAYNYFLVPASYLKKDHSWDDKSFPAATSNKYAFFQEFYSAEETEKYFYYSNLNDNYKLYRISKDGNGKAKVFDARAPYFALTSDSIYFSNYSNGGYLYKANLDGSELKQLNQVLSIDLYIEKNILFYTNKATGITEKLIIQVNPLEEKLNKFKNFKEFSNVKPNKKWTVTFNLELNESSINKNNIYVLDENGELVSAIPELSENKKQIYVQPPAELYQKGKTYYLFLENILSYKGKSLKEPTRIKFTIEQ
ncbi:DUF5050 domain-containing protein [Metabacillus fastidiosus]|uniref:DUF5050 domain-containing protein n=1 Tax=Metabacillus fastidiosus TaxID=1458 RepID=UPI002E224673|nr:DUF5050 domain-containing protein [Metabacillus fastidiosus]